MNDASEARDRPRYTRDELVAELGLSADFAEKAWNAFGFVRQPSSDKVFSDRDLAALRMFASSSAAMPETSQIAMARAIGQTMSRLAEWEADLLRDIVDDPAVPWDFDQMSLALGQIQQLIWRRHMAQAIERHTDHSDDEEIDLIVGFADIVGYTSLSRRIDLNDLESLLGSFEDDTFDVVVDHGGRVIKTLGDAVMFTFDDAPAAASAALEIHQLSTDDSLPPLRVGMARGSVLARLGDVFGEPVNIASRLAGSARPGTTLIDDAIADQLGGDDRFYLKSIPTLRVRGYKHLKARVLEAHRDGPLND
ncbi:MULTISPECIES: adenylate/guanylate cyclase domain-containing protein [unclassified Gordonia (in: high G+C Gram-positive bacteria)]|uniref:adenylate/guanylate cyclase domain-containing protein n=1 Tax=unclassified Gordonia (in: high G+C Gram-positive bacteria) TaxID=2657482 RepID=UPI00080E6146|nr:MULTISPECIES: adenylate/guanylate cyclase domain-containing protein [unclassified Gordonia (in: high G+C Gram-positive bacteria)]MCT1352043.1 adenylate/guanylate cyclase domain-containing protein [Gordonia sp. p3-SID1431]MCX2755162.1 adenylate/guanylate cyclase domain-containing protein [Gordonia sp. 4N]OCH81666.1 guanylyl cyclase [Gordonia sp. UCD-TK1]